RRRDGEAVNTPATRLPDVFRTHSRSSAGPRSVSWYLTPLPHARGPPPRFTLHVRTSGAELSGRRSQTALRAPRSRPPIECVEEGMRLRLHQRHASLVSLLRIGIGVQSTRRRCVRVDARWQRRGASRRRGRPRPRQSRAAAFRGAPETPVGASPGTQSACHSGRSGRDRLFPKPARPRRKREARGVRAMRRRTFLSYGPNGAGLKLGFMNRNKETVSASRKAPEFFLR
ncbi:uncharacterized protein Tco025E_08022, partial [Trypanosoma conorhini]